LHPNRTTFFSKPKLFLILAKKRIVKDYDALTEEIVKSVKLKYPTGYEQHLITYKDKDNKIVSALPFETDDIYYLIRMTSQEARRLVKSDEDFDDEGNLRAEPVEDIEVDNEFDGDGEDDDDFDDTDDEESDHIIVTRRRGDSDDMDDIPDDSY
jgi:DNA-directed RNA polymerase subunit delta